MSHPKSFGRIRSLIWPVHGYELKKFLPMFFLSFLVTFNYNLLRTTKDTLAIKASSAGAEIIPYIKVWVMLPTALFMVFLFNRVSDRLSRERTFYAMNSIFLSYFVLFITVLYPQRDELYLDSVADQLEIWLPIGFKGFIAMIRYWMITSFYVMSELWGTTILSVSFWGFANEVTRISEAKRFYALLGLGSNLSGYFSGNLAILFLKHNYNPVLPFGSNAWDQSLTFIVMTVCTVGILSLGIFRWLNKRVLTNPLYYDPHHQEESVAFKKKNKPKRGKLKDDLSLLVHSPYLLAIATIVLAFGFTINVLEVLWKNIVSQHYPDPSDFSVFMNKVVITISILSTFTALFISGNVIRFFGWTITAIITPLILLVTSIGFFGFLLFPEQLSPVSAFFGLAPLALSVYFGTAQNVLSRSAKYTLFDATKEMAFIPLDRTTKLKGKAAIDGLISRLGKSGASVLYSVLLPVFGSLTLCVPYMAFLLFSCLGAWSFSVRYIGTTFNELTKPQDQAPKSTGPSISLNANPSNILSKKKNVGEKTTTSV